MRTTITRAGDVHHADDGEQEHRQRRGKISRKITDSRHPPLFFASKTTLMRIFSTPLASRAPGVLVGFGVRRG